MPIWYEVWPFGICVGYLVYFPPFGKYYREKSGNPDQLQDRKNVGSNPDRFKGDNIEMLPCKIDIICIEIKSLAPKSL
jgi:hypothetical protein